MPETIVRAFRTELRPTEAQKRTLGRWCGAARYVYNWALEERIRAYEERGETLSAYAQDKELTRLKRTEDHAWRALRAREDSGLADNLRSCFGLCAPRARG